MIWTKGTFAMLRPAKTFLALLWGGLFVPMVDLHSAPAQGISREESSYRVVGGNVAAEGAWPWQIAIYLKRPDNTFAFYCGGTIISEHWVLSAAHCVSSRNPKDLLIVEGTNNIDNPRGRADGKGHAIEVRRLVPHENYDAQTSENDIALLELASPAQSEVALLAGSPDLELETAGRASYVTGWGTVRAMRIVGGQLIDVVRPGDPNYFTDRLMQAELPLVDRETCRQAHSAGTKKIDERNLCAGLEEGGKDSCQGDSGGPLLTRDDRGRYVQVGIISWGKSCGLPKSYGVNTRVAAFDKWIQSTAGLVTPPQVATVPLPRPAETPAKPPEVSVATVAQSTLWQDNPAGLTVDIVQGNALRLGQSAEFRVTAQKAGYLLLIDMTPDGKMTQIFPNARSLSTPTGARKTSNLIEPGRPFLVPDRRNPYEGFEMKVEAPTGTGLLVAVLSERPIRSVSVPDAPRTMERAAAIDFISQLAEELDRDLVVQGQQRLRGWSVAMKPYRVDP
jgi:secreted trypsin-like serine protease